MIFNPFRRVIETSEFPMARIYRTDWVTGILDTFDVLVGRHVPSNEDWEEENEDYIEQKEIRWGVMDYLTFGIPLLLNHASKKFNILNIINIPVAIAYYGVGVALTLAISPIVALIHILTFSKAIRLKNDALSLEGDTGLHERMIESKDDAQEIHVKLDSEMDMQADPRKLPGLKSAQARQPQKFPLSVIQRKSKDSVFLNSSYSSELKDDHLYVIKDGRKADVSSWKMILATVNPRFHPCRSYCREYPHVSTHPLLLKVPLNATSTDNTKKKALKAYLELNVAHVSDNAPLSSKIKSLTK